VAGQKVGWEQLAENQMKLSPKRAAQIDNLPPEQRAVATERTVKFARIFSYAFPLAFQLPFLLIVAAVLMASFNFRAGAEIPFRHRAGGCDVRQLLVRAVPAIVSLLAGANPESFTFQNPVATNPGYVLDPVASPLAVSAGFRAGCGHHLDLGADCNWLCRGHQAEAPNDVRGCLGVVHRVRPGVHRVLEDCFRRCW
jgi:hypothetical protein